MYLEYNNIDVLHLEITSLCNARCPQCARTNNKLLPLNNMTLTQVKKYFPVDFIKNLSRMYSCGNYGDPIVNPECFEIFKYFIDNGCTDVSLHTNGGVRDTEFWNNLGKNKVRVVFAIDGLEDTNDMYRVGVNWNTLMRNAKTFIKAGGIADWAYLLFDHNEHQVEEARELSKQLGFRKFTTKATSRFSNKNKVVNKKQQEIKVAQASKKHVKDKQTAIETYGSWENYLEQTPILCKTQLEESIYVDFEGKLWPCCWTGPSINKYSPDRVDLLPQYNKTHNDLNVHTLKDIIEADWFRCGLKQSWEPGTSRLKICPATCGEIYSPVNHMWNLSMKGKKNG